ncbi:MAG TPA: phosphatidate cytidylyltransferase, partial [Candidatus Glassbacteria bacterium]|nr:phosphatidate cytidylyltransferase [Candidatus Glassbacteria bacterium]
MLRVRLVAAAAILVPLGGILYADVHWNAGVPGIWLVPLGWIISLLAAAEVLDLLRTPGHRPLAWTVYTGVTLVFLAACVPMLWPLSGLPYPPNCPLGKLGWPLLALVAALTLALVGEMRRYEQPGGVIVNLALAVFTIVYVGVPLAFAALLRQFHDNRWGMAALVSAILVVKLSDTGAYFFGKRFGRRKLAPRLSPGKTVAGGIGCLVFAVGAAFCFTQLLAPQMTGQAPRTSLMGTAAYGLILAVTGVLGDLGESLLKRDMGRKDSSSWLPGLGGVL